jgi:hypothetical protein
VVRTVETFRVAVNGAVDTLTRVSFETCTPPVKDITGFANWAGVSLASKVRGPAKPFRAVIVMIELPLLPLAIVRELALRPTV